MSVQWWDSRPPTWSSAAAAWRALPPSTARTTTWCGCRPRTASARSASPSRPVRTGRCVYLGSMRCKIIHVKNWCAGNALGNAIKQAAGYCRRKLSPAASHIWLLCTHHLMAARVHAMCSRPNTCNFITYEEMQPAIAPSTDAAQCACAAGSIKDTAGNVMYTDPTASLLFVINSDNGQAVTPSAQGMPATPRAWPAAHCTCCRHVCMSCCWVWPPA